MNLGKALTYLKIEETTEESAEWVELRQLAANELGVQEYGANEAPTAGAGRLWTWARDVCRLK